MSGLWPRPYIAISQMRPSFERRMLAQNSNNTRVAAVERRETMFRSPYLGKVSVRAREGRRVRENSAKEMHRVYAPGQLKRVNVVI